MQLSCDCCGKIVDKPNDLIMLNHIFCMGSDKTLDGLFVCYDCQDTMFDAYRRFNIACISAKDKILIDTLKPYFS